MRGCCLFRQSMSDAKHRSFVPRWGLIVLLAGMVTVSGCGGDDSGANTSPSPPTQPVTNPAVPETPPVAAEKPEAEEPNVDQQQALATPVTPQAQADAPAGESPFEMSYLDPATELFVYAQPAAIKSSPIVQALTGGQLGPLDGLKEQIGIGIDQIESVTIGVSQLQQMSEQSAEQMAAPPMGGMPANPLMPPMMPAPTGIIKNVIMVVRTSEPVNLDELKLPEGEGFAKTHESKSYHQLAEIGEDSPFLYAANETTLIVATETAIQSIIDQGDTPSHATADLSFVSTASHVIVAVVPKNQEMFFSALPPIPTPNLETEVSAEPETKPGFAVGGIPDVDEDEDEDRGKGKGKNRRKKDEDDRGRIGRNIRVPDEDDDVTKAEDVDAVEKGDLQKLLETHAKGIALRLDLGADLKIEITTQCDIPASALRMQKELDSVIVQGKQMFEVVRGMVPGLIQELAQPMMDSLVVTADGTTVSIATTLPESQQANLTMLPMVVMGMMMSQSGSVEVIQQMVDWQERAQEVLDEGQLSVLKEDIPEGLQVYGLARWSLPQQGRELAHPWLELAIVCTGGPVAHVNTFGQLKLTEANAYADAPLKWLGVSRNGRADDPLHDLVVVNQGDEFSPHPPKGLATGFIFHPPGEDIQSIEAVAGEVILEIPTSLREITLSNVSGNSIPIDDPVLQSTNFVVTAETKDGQAVVKSTYDAHAPIDHFTIVDASGKMVEASNSSQVLADNQIHREWQLPQWAKQPLSLEVSVWEDVQEVLVPFRFENLPMPKPAPQFSGQTPLRSWTAANPTPELPEGLSLQAQVRWNASHSQEIDFSEFAEQQESTPSGSPSMSTLTGRGGLGLGSRRDEEEEERTQSGKGGGGLSRKDEKEQRRRGKGKGGEVTERRSGIRIADDDGEGVTVPATRAKEARAAQVAGSLDGRLQFVVDLVGPPVESTVVIGELQVDSAIADGGNELEYEGGQYGRLDVTDDLADVEQDQGTQMDQPPNGLRVIYKFVRPESPIQMISEMKGTLHIRTVRERIEAVVPNLNNRTDIQIKDRILTKYGIEFAVVVDGDELKYRTLKGDENRIDKFFPVDDGGTRIDGVTHLTSTDNGNQIHVFRFPRDVPDRVGLKFIINLGVQDIDVPVEFSDVPVPPAPGQISVQ